MTYGKRCLEETTSTVGKDFGKVTWDENWAASFVCQELNEEFVPAVEQMPTPDTRSSETSTTLFDKKDTGGLAGPGCYP